MRRADAVLNAANRLSATLIVSRAPVGRINRAAIGGVSGSVPGRYEKSILILVTRPIPRTVVPSIPITWRIRHAFDIWPALVPSIVHLGRRRSECYPRHQNDGGDETRLSKLEELSFAVHRFPPALAFRNSASLQIPARVSTPKAAAFVSSAGASGFMVADPDLSKSSARVAPKCTSQLTRGTPCSDCPVCRHLICLPAIIALRFVRARNPQDHLRPSSVLHTFCGGTGSRKARRKMSSPTRKVVLSETRTLFGI